MSWPLRPLSFVSASRGMWSASAFRHFLCPTLAWRRSSRRRRKSMDPPRWRQPATIRPAAR